RTPLTLIAVAEDAAALTEKVARQAMRANPPPPSACREGCDWCCHLTVGTTAPEVVRIVQYLRQTLSPDEFRALRQRVIRLDAERRASPAATRGGARLPCALLIDNRCPSQHVRPLTLRGFIPIHASECERFSYATGKSDLTLELA